MTLTAAPWPQAPPGLRVWSGRGPDTVLPEDVALLSAAELARLRGFGDPLRAARYAAAHAAVRRHLGLLLDTGPAAVRFGRLPCPGCGSPGHGRPVISGPDTHWQFSLSRSGPYWLCAAAPGVPVGADIECLRPVDATGLATAVLCAPERAHLAALAPALRGPEFLRCWTRKEAVVKAIGIGLEADLRAVDVQPHRPLALVGPRPGTGVTGRWAVRDLPGGEDHVAALALPL